MTTFILVRHGQTEWNREERFRGRMDIPLNEMGLSQAEAAGRRIAAEWSPAAVYSSPLSRCLQTAQAIASAIPGRPLEPVIEEGLLDVDYGDWQGLSPQEVARRYGSLYDTWLNAPHQAQFPNGENLTQVRARIVAALERLAARHPSETIVLVSHLSACRVLLLAVLGLDNSHFWRIAQENGALNVFTCEQSTFYVVTLNDTCHQRALG
jgi:broad specificity phosphatase PhoE